MHSAMKWLALGAMGCGFHVQGNGDVQTRTVKVGVFDGLFNGAFFDVTLQQGPAGQVELTCDGNLLDLMEVEVQADELRIHKTIMGGMRPTRPCLAVVNVPADHDLRALRNAGSGDVTSALDLRLEEIRSSGSGDIDLAFTESDELSLHLSGSGRVEVAEVLADTLFVDANGSGDARIGALTGDFVSDQSGSGSVLVRQMEGRFIDGGLVLGEPWHMGIAEEGDARGAHLGGKVRGLDHVFHRLEG